MAKQEAQEQANVEGKAGRQAGSLTIPLALALSVGLAVGAGAGTYVAGPLLAKRIVQDMDSVAEAAGEADAGDSHDSGEGGHGGHGSGDDAPAAVHTIENLVINPAQSNGTRYLLLSLSLAVGDEQTAAEIERRDSEIRDAVISMLGTRNVAELSDHESRDGLKEELRETIDSLLGRPAIEAVYFPQYVIY